MKSESLPSQSQFDPLIKLTQEKHGLKSAVLRRFIALGGVATWGQISDWLHTDETKRRVPRETARELLLKVQSEIILSETKDDHGKK